MTAVKRIREKGVIYVNIGDGLRDDVVRVARIEVDELKLLVSARAML